MNSNPISESCDGEDDLEESLTRSEVEEFVLNTFEEEFDKKMPIIEGKLAAKAKCLEKDLRRYVQDSIES